MLKVTLSSKGQIVIPKTVRDRLNLCEGAELAVEMHGQDLILRQLPKRDWRQWSGRFPGGGMLQELEREHREEVRRDQKGS